MKTHMAMPKLKHPMPRSLPSEHSPPKPAARPSRTICRYFHQEKGCGKGQTCGFRHVTDAKALYKEGLAICAAHYKIQNIAYMTWIVDPHDLHNNDGLYICSKDQPCRLTDAEKRFNPQFPLTSRLTTGKTKEALRRELSSSSAGERHSTAHTTTRPNDQQPRKNSTNSGPIGAPTQTHKAIIGARSNPRGIGSSSNISRAVLTPNSSSAQRRVQDSQHLAKPKTPIGQRVNAARKTSPTATSTKTDASAAQQSQESNTGTNQSADAQKTQNIFKSQGNDKTNAPAPAATHAAEAPAAGVPFDCSAPEVLKHGHHPLETEVGQPRESQAHDVAQLTPYIEPKKIAEPPTKIQRIEPASIGKTSAEPPTNKTMHTTKKTQHIESASIATCKKKDCLNTTYAVGSRVTLVNEGVTDFGCDFCKCVLDSGGVFFHCSTCSAVQCADCAFKQ